MLARGLRCPYCMQKMKGAGFRSPTRDHIVPRSLGGVRIVMCCRRCNQNKSNYSLRSWAALLAQRNDYRAKVVTKFANKLDSGELRLCAGSINTLGFEPGIFA